MESYTENGSIFSNIFFYLVLILAILIFLVFFYFICSNCCCRDHSSSYCCCFKLMPHRLGYENIESDSTLSPTETRLAKSSFYIRSVPNLSTKHRAEDQQETMAPVQVDFQVFKILHERFKQQVLSSTKKYFDIKESANKPLIDL